MLTTTFTRDRLTWLFYLQLTYYAFYINALGPLTPYLKAELNLSYTVGSLHYTAFAAGILLVGLAGHAVVGRLGRWRSLWLGAGGMSLGVLLLIAGRVPLVTVGGALLMGTVGSLILVIVPAALTDHHGRGATQALSEANLSASLIAVAAPLLVGWFAPLPGGWRVPLGLVALAPLVLRLAIGRVGVPEGRSTVQAEGGDARTPLPGLFWVYWAVIVMGVAAEFCMLAWSADHLAKHLGLAPNAAAQAVSLFLAGMIVGRLAGSRLVRRFPAQAIVLGSAAVGAAGFVFFWLSSSVPLGLAGLFVTGAGVASLYPMTLSLAMHSAAGQTVQAAARTTLASGIAILALPLTLGRLADGFGIQAAYTVELVLLAGVAGVILVSTKFTKQEEIRKSVSYRQE